MNAGNRAALRPLKTRRLRRDLLRVHKTIPQIKDVTKCIFFQISSITTRKDNQKLKEGYFCLDVRKYFFSQRIVKESNSLPYDFINGT